MATATKSKPSIRVPEPAIKTFALANDIEDPQLFAVVQSEEQRTAWIDGFQAGML